ncbi:MAG TPA: hypothetical protein VGR87_08880 [Candidatus Limnocylindria bacterium]|jgi:hypothetical protein|nr:hypothetical protein [Candidatus Limnocylindria bacterium]
MESLRDERGQALVVLVLLLGLASVVVIGLRTAQDRLFAVTHVHRAGEAAVEAAAQSVADAYAARRRPDVNGLVADPRVVEEARAAADALARENGAASPGDLEVTCSGGKIQVRLVLAGYAHHAGFSAPECSRP